MICPRDAERASAPVRERVLELVGPAGVVEEVRRGERQVDVARLLDRLAAVRATRAPRTRASAPGGCARSGTGTSRAREPGQRRPAVLRTPSRAARDGAADIGRSGSPARSRRSGSSVARADRRVTSRAGSEPLAADEEAVAPRGASTMSRDSGARAYVPARRRPRRRSALRLDLRAQPQPAPDVVRLRWAGAETRWPSVPYWNPPPP